MPPARLRWIAAEQPGVREGAETLQAGLAVCLGSLFEGGGKERLLWGCSLQQNG